MPPLLMGAARFLTAGVLLYAIARFRGAPSVRSLSRKQLGASWLVGSLLVAGGNGVVNVAEQYIPSSLAAVVISSGPLWGGVMRRGTGGGGSGPPPGGGGGGGCGGARPAPPRG